MNKTNDTATKQALEQTWNNSDNMAGKTEEQVQSLKEKLSVNLADAAEKLHQKSDSTQEFLDKKTDVINEFAHQTIEKANQFGHRAGEVLDSSSDYVKTFDIQEQKEQITETLRQNIGKSFAIAGIFGLIVGLLIGSRKFK